MGEKIGIHETSELLDFLTLAVEEIGKYRSDDGKISVIEWAQAAMKLAPKTLGAFTGLEQVDDEVKDLDSAETKALAAKGLALGQAVATLLGFGKVI